MMSFVASMVPKGVCPFSNCATAVHCNKDEVGGVKQKLCSMAGCTATSKRKGLCAKHGGGRSKCWIAECTSLSVSKLKLCHKHGGVGFCTHPSGCRTVALKTGGNCKRHTSK